MNTAFLRRAIQLSIDKMQADEGGPFGAIIVRDGEIIGQGWNRVTSSNDPTSHAEINAIRAACQKIHNYSLAGCEIYSSCEPCPMCLAAIFWSRLERIFHAASCADAATAGFDDRSFYVEIAKPKQVRRIPMQQALRDEAQEAFRLWLMKDDRQDY